jgi:hypothetical protein
MSILTVMQTTQVSIKIIVSTLSFKLIYYFNHKDILKTMANRYVVDYYNNVWHLKKHRSNMGVGHCIL